MIKAPTSPSDRTVPARFAGRLYRALADVFREEFGGRLQKISVDAGFDCPNRDGTKGTGGCTYCLNRAFNPSYCSPGKPVSQQLREGIQFHARRYRRAVGYLAYFQAYSNTYAPVAHLEELYREAKAVDGIVGWVIATRPDCLSRAVLNLLQRLSAEGPVFLELGAESSWDHTLDRINRCHSFTDTVRAVEEAAGRGLKVGVHAMFGLPGETVDDMLVTGERLGALPIHSIKLHQLQIYRDTPMEREWREQPEAFHAFTLESYLDFAVDLVEQFSPGIAVDRVAAEAPPRFLAYTPWSGIRYDEVQRRFEARLEERETWQGRRFAGLP